MQITCYTLSLLFVYINSKSEDKKKVRYFFNGQIILCQKKFFSEEIVKVLFSDCLIPILEHNI